MNVGLLALSFVAGLAIGAAYLLGLWWTVRRVTRTGNARLLPLSFVARAALALLAFYGMLRSGPVALVVALLGFLSARWLLTRLIGRGEDADDAVA